MYEKFALTPPMGWNSWDCYGASVNEQQLIANAEYMAKHLKPFGWEYIVCDIQWYEPTASGFHYHNFAPVCIDECSRVIPSEERFPSSAGGRGFGPIADYVHSLGLKFGIHIMRGIPRLAVHLGTPIKAPGKTARDIAAQFSVCPWNTDMYGVNCDAEGAREYYNSLFELYASWGVDFVKCDDIANTEFRPDMPYSAKGEIELIRNAIENCGRQIVLSLSPGPAPVNEHAHLAEHADMWRITGDFWDSWDKLHEMFGRCNLWQEYVTPGAWPDCDMLPIGRLALCDFEGQGRWTEFTQDEQITLMTLWSIFRSPLIIGGDLRYNDEFTLSLLTNTEVLEMHRNSSGAHQVRRDEKDGKGEIIWQSQSERFVYTALFNTDSAPGIIEFECDKSVVHDMWKNEDIPYEGSLEVPPHGARLIKTEK